MKQSWLIRDELNREYVVRLATEEDVREIRLLVNQSFQELAERGLNYTAASQDDEVTRRRMAAGRTFVLVHRGAIVGTVHLRQELGHLYLSQLGIHPHHKRQGLGTALMDFVENLALHEKHLAIRLDTAKPATHLVRFYQRRHYEIVDQTRFDGKTYESWIFEKRLLLVEAEVALA